MHGGTKSAATGSTGFIVAIEEKAMTIKNAMRAALRLRRHAGGKLCEPHELRSDDLYDPEQNHPITVEPSYQTLKVSFSGKEAGLMPDDEAHFMDFVQTYIAHGNGAISVSAPAWSRLQDVIHYFGDRSTRWACGPRAFWWAPAIPPPPAIAASKSATSPTSRMPIMRRLVGQRCRYGVESADEKFRLRRRSTIWPSMSPIRAIWNRRAH